MEKTIEPNASISKANSSAEPSASELLLDNDWVECFDKKSQRPYYYSKIRKQSVWKPPPAFIYRKQQEKINILNVPIYANEGENNASQISQPLLVKSSNGTNKHQPITLSIKLTDSVVPSNNRNNVPFTSQKSVPVGNNSANSKSPSKPQGSNNNSVRPQQQYSEQTQYDNRGRSSNDNEINANNGNGTSSYLDEEDQYQESHQTNNISNRVNSQFNNQEYQQRSQCQQNEYDQGSNNFSNNQYQNGLTEEGEGEEAQYYDENQEGDYRHLQEQGEDDAGYNDQGEEQMMINDNYISDSSQDEMHNEQYDQYYPSQSNVSRSGSNNRGKESSILLEPPNKKPVQAKPGELGYADKFIIDQHKKSQRAASPSGRNIYTNKTVLQEFAKAQSIQQKQQQQSYQPQQQQQ